MFWPRRETLLPVILAWLWGSPANAELKLPAPTYPESVRLLGISDPTAALARLEDMDGDQSPPRLESQLLRATLLSAVGRDVDAESVWSDVIDHVVWMRTFARRALVTSLVKRGEPGAAEAILNGLNHSGATRHLDLSVRVTNLYLAQGNHKAAAAGYQSLLRRQSHGAFADRARLGLAAVHEADGDLERAVTLVREAQLQHRTAATFTEARTTEQRLSRQLGRSHRPFTPEQYRTLTRRLRQTSRYTEAVQLINAWRVVTPHASEQLDFELIGALYDGRSNAEAVRLCASFAQEYPSSPLLPDVKLTEFRLAVRMGLTERARTLGLRIWRGEVTNATAEHRFSTGELLSAYLVSVGDVEGGLALYRELFHRATTPDARRMMLWKAGVAALRAEQDERALTNLRALNQRRPTGGLRPAGVYWEAVAEERTGQSKAAAQRFRSLVMNEPYSYYGLLARDRLLDLGEDVPTPPSRTFPSLSLGASTPNRAEYKAAMALARAGLTSDAAWYLRRLLDQQRNDRGLALLATRASADAGDYRDVARLVVNHFREFLERPADDLPENFYALIYPTPFVGSVSEAAHRRGLDPAVMFAIMRRESRFDPNARSAVGALGLFQIMPYTATALGPRSELDHLSSEDFAEEQIILQPPVNAALATTLARDLFTMFDDALAPVIASYNAGEDRVSIWWESARNLRQDLFVDTIPYSETRRFAKEVIANVEGYRRVYGNTLSAQ